MWPAKEGSGLSGAHSVNDRNPRFQILEMHKLDYGWRGHRFVSMQATDSVALSPRRVRTSPGDLKELSARVLRGCNSEFAPASFACGVSRIQSDPFAPAHLL